MIITWSRNFPLSHSLSLSLSLSLCHFLFLGVFSWGFGFCFCFGFCNHDPQRFQTSCLHDLLIPLLLLLLLLLCFELPFSLLSQTLQHWQNCLTQKKGQFLTQIKWGPTWFLLCVSFVLNMWVSVSDSNQVDVVNWDWFFFFFFSPLI